MSEIAVGLHRRAKGTADHRAEFVKLTFTGCGIENRTRLVIRKIIPAFCCLVGIVLVEHAGNRIPGIVLPKLCDCVEHALSQPRRPLWIARLEFSQAVAQADGIQLVDCEDAMATLRTPRLARQPLVAFLKSVSQRGVNDLNQFSIPGRRLMAWHKGFRQPVFLAVTSSTTTSRTTIPSRINHVRSA